MVPPAPPNPYAPPGQPPQPGDGLGPLPREAPDAKQALILGIVSLFCCGIVLGPVAIMKANNARQAIAMDPTLRGGGMATAGMVLGIVSLVLNLLGLAAQFLRHR